jgi:predicted transposase YdaD
LLALANVGCEFKLMKTLEKVSCSYATEDLRHRADDVVWQVRAEGQWVYLYILIEFQSTVDAFMAVRIMSSATPIKRIDDRF